MHGEPLERPVDHEPEQQAQPADHEAEHEQRPPRHAEEGHGAEVGEDETRLAAGMVRCGAAFLRGEDAGEREPGQRDEHGGPERKQTVEHGVQPTHRVKSPGGTHEHLIVRPAVGIE